jgi:hypothetical protein
MTAPWSLSDLREHTIQRAKGRCEWPDCTMAGEQMAHLEHRGMGGRTSVNQPDNVVWLCLHHHLTLDLEKPIRRFELRELLRVAIGQR